MSDGRSNERSQHHHLQMINDGSCFQTFVSFCFSSFSPDDFLSFEYFALCRLKLVILQFMRVCITQVLFNYTVSLSGYKLLVFFCLSFIDMYLYHITKVSNGLYILFFKRVCKGLRGRAGITASINDYDHSSASLMRSP